MSRGGGGAARHHVGIYGGPMGTEQNENATLVPDYGRMWGQVMDEVGEQAMQGATLEDRAPWGWQARCGLHDVEPIASVEALDAIVRDGATGMRGAWPTLDTALRALLPDEDAASVEVWVAYQDAHHPSVDWRGEVAKARAGRPVTG